MMDNLHLTEAQIVEFAAKGELGFKDIAKSIAEPGKSLDKMTSDFESRTKTADEAWREFKQDLSQPVGLDEIDAQLRAQDPTVIATRNIQKLADQMKDGVGVWKDSADAVNKYNAALRETIDTARKDIWTEQISLVGELQKGYGLLTMAVGKYADYTIAAKNAAHEQAIEMAKLRAEMANEAQILALQMDLNPEFNGLSSVKKQVDETASAIKEFQRAYQDAVKQQNDAQAEATRKYADEQTKILDKAIESERDHAKVLLDPMKDALKDFITTGHADLEQMFKSIADTGVSKLLDAGETSLLQQMFGKTSQESAIDTSFATGGVTAGGEIASAMTGAGAVVATQIAGALAGSGLFSAAGFASGAGGAASIGGLGASDLPTGDVGSIARTGGLTMPTITHTPIGVARAAAQPVAHTTKVTNIVNMMYDRRAIISNADDDQRLSSALRRNPNLFVAMGKWR
jgi:tetratricopeptide (TPR) repeat protein